MLTRVWNHLTSHTFLHSMSAKRYSYAGNHVVAFAELEYMYMMYRKSNEFMSISAVCWVSESLKQHWLLHS